MLSATLRRRRFPPYVSSRTKLPYSAQNVAAIKYDRLDSWKPNRNDFQITGNFTIASFNLLAPVYKRQSTLDIETGFRRRESQYPELWQARAMKTRKFFEESLFNSADIIALQEFWLNVKYLNIFREEFYKFGYEMLLLQRTGTKLDAVVLLVKTDSFDIKQVENVYLCNMRDRVALLTWLRHKKTGKDIIVANTHLSFPHNNLESISQVQQMEIITKVMDNFAHRYDISHVTRLVVGDFNAEMKSRVCEHLRKTGFSSCFEISPPFNPQLDTITPHIIQPPHTHHASQSNTTHHHSNQHSHSHHHPLSQHHHPSHSHASPSSETTANPTSLYSHSMQHQHYGLTTFVSHRNHLKEDVGVDHIFVRPETDKATASPVSLVDWTLSASIEDEEEDVREEDEHRHHTPLPIHHKKESDHHSNSNHSEVHVSPNSHRFSHHTDSDNQHSHSTAGNLTASHSDSDDSHRIGTTSSSSVEVLEEKLFVDDCHVLPKNKTHQLWDEDFRISDHRPVTATIIFGKRKSHKERLREEGEEQSRLG